MGPSSNTIILAFLRRARARKIARIRVSRIRRRSAVILLYSSRVLNRELVLFPRIISKHERSFGETFRNEPRQRDTRVGNLGRIVSVLIKKKKEKKTTSVCNLITTEYFSL